MTPRPLAEIVGAFVKAYRRRHKVTKDQLALAGMTYGMTWGRTSIDNIESGKSAATIPVIFALCSALSRLGRERVTIDDLIPDGAEVLMSGEFTLTGSSLKKFLAGTPVSTPVGQSLDAMFRSLAGHAASYSLAEKRAAVALGLDTADLVALSLNLWGDRLDAVVTQSVGRDATPQKRGHETRRRVEELRKAAESANG